MCSPQDRFNEKHIPVTESGCWIWTAGLSPDGYGKFKMNKKTVRAHRASWEFNCGKIPEGQQVLHKCDTPTCVNPDHLFLGSHKENMVDRSDKNRQCYGEKNGEAKLTEGEVIEIRALKGKLFQREIAAIYNVSRGHISTILSGDCWKHLEQEVV